MIMGEVCSCNTNQEHERIPSNVEALTSVTSTKYRNSINRVINIKTGEREIHLAVRNENTTFIQFLVENGCDINTQATKTKDTPLHIASQINSSKMVLLLLSLDANPNILNGNEKLAIDLCNDKIRLVYQKHEQNKTNKIKKKKHKRRINNNSNNNNKSHKSHKSNKLHQTKESKSLETATIKSIQIKSNLINNRIVKSEQTQQDLQESRFVDKPTDKQSPSPSPGIPSDQLSLKYNCNNYKNTYTHIYTL